MIFTIVRKSVVMENEFLRRKELLIGVTMEIILVVMVVMTDVMLKKISNVLEVTKPQ